MITFALLLDGGPFREWQLFSWSIYFPAIAIAISWVLIRRNRKLVIVALGIAALAAVMLVDELYGDLRFREEIKSDIIKGMNWEKMEAYRNDPNLTPEERKLLYIPKSKIQLNDLEMYGGIPPYDRTIIQAVWFAALFPFVAIAAFYLSAANSTKAQKSLLKPDSS